MHWFDDRLIVPELKDSLDLADDPCGDGLERVLIEPVPLGEVRVSEDVIVRDYLEQLYHSVDVR